MNYSVESQEASHTNDEKERPERRFQEFSSSSSSVPIGEYADNRGRHQRRNELAQPKPTPSKYPVAASTAAEQEPVQHDSSAAHQYVSESANGYNGTAPAADSGANSGAFTSPEPQPKIEYTPPESDDGISRYYRALELTLSANQDEIKSQYKRLVRLHHPDQFIDAAQKRLAEEQLKTINEAYRVLSSRAVEGQLVRYAQQAMGLTVEPDVLDFGLLERKERRSATFQVSFDTEIEGIDFVPSEEDSWFRVAKVSHLYGSQRASLEFEIEVDTTGLVPQTYQGWIDLYLDDAMTRLPLTMQVSARRWQAFHLPRRWILVATFVLAFLFFTTTLAFTKVGPFAEPSVIDSEAMFGQVALNGNRSVMVEGSGVSALGAIAASELYFSLLSEDGQATIYHTSLHSKAIPQLSGTGRQATTAQNGQYIAYLHCGCDENKGFDSPKNSGSHSAQSINEQTGRLQVFLYNNATGRTTQLTLGQEVKSSLAWSPDGKSLAYLLGSGEKARIALFIVDSQLNYQLPGAITAGVGNFAWSPDSKSLLFDLWRGAERRVYRMAVPDGELQQLTQFDSWAGTWSPDGTTIVVGSPAGLYRLDGNGRQLRQLTTDRAEHPSWSADGNWIAFLTQPIGRSNAAGRLWIMRPDGTSASHVANDILQHEWSPQGATIAYITGPRQATEPLYYLWQVQPGGQRQLVAEINDPHFSWGR